VKQFIREDLEKYENTEFKAIPGHIPELVLLDADNNEIDRIDLSEKSRDQCNELLKEHGFKLKSPTEEEASPDGGDEL